MKVKERIIVDQTSAPFIVFFLSPYLHIPGLFPERPDPLLKEEGAGAGWGGVEKSGFMFGSMSHGSPDRSLHCLAILSPN